MSAILPHREITPQRPDSLADDAGAGEPVSPCYPLFTPVLLKNRDIFSVTMLPDFVIFQSIRAIALRHGNSDHSSTYQGCFWAISGDLCLNNRGTDTNDRESSRLRSAR